MENVKYSMAIDRLEELGEFLAAPIKGVYENLSGRADSFRNTMKEGWDSMDDGRRKGVKNAVSYGVPALSLNTYLTLRYGLFTDLNAPLFSGGGLNDLVSIFSALIIASGFYHLLRENIPIQPKRGQMKLEEYI